MLSEGKITFLTAFIHLTLMNINEEWVVLVKTGCELERHSTTIYYNTMIRKTVSHVSHSHDSFK